MVRLGLRENVTLLRFGISGTLLSQLELQLLLSETTDPVLFNLFNRGLIADNSKVFCLNSERVFITEICLEIVGLPGCIIPR